MDKDNQGVVIGVQAAKNISTGYSASDTKKADSRKLHKDTLIEMKWKINQELLTAALKLPRGKDVIKGFEHARRAVSRAIERLMRESK